MILAGTNPAVYVSGLLQVEGRLPAIEQRYDELVSLSASRRQALDGALALYRMYSEAGACQLWVEEKEQWLHGMEIPTKLEDLEVVQQRSVWPGSYRMWLVAKLISLSLLQL